MASKQHGNTHEFPIDVQYVLHYVLFKRQRDIRILLICAATDLSALAVAYQFRYWR
jgi:hypothetical protein